MLGIWRERFDEFFRSALEITIDRSGCGVRYLVTPDVIRAFSRRTQTLDICIDLVL